MNRLLVPPVTAKAETTGTLYLYDSIGSDGFSGITSKDVIGALSELKTAGHKSLEIRINSPGGSVFEGLAIYQALASWEGPKTAMVDGLSASAASFVMLAADKVMASPASMFMIHEARGMAMGTAADMEATAALLRKANDSIASIYDSRTCMDPKRTRKMMADETWMSATEAKDCGLITGLTEDERSPVGAAVSEAAAAIIATFKNPPAEVRALARPEALVRLEMRILREQLSAAMSRRTPAQTGADHTMGS